MDPRSPDHPQRAAGLNRRALLTGLTALIAVPSSAYAARPGSEYLRAHRKMTKKLVIYRGFGTALYLRATLLTPSFRELLATERHRLLGNADAGDAAFRASMKEDGAAYHEIVFAADSSEPNARRFGNAEDRWNLQLNVGNRPPWFKSNRSGAQPASTKHCTHSSTSGPTSGLPVSSATVPNRVRSPCR